LFGPQTGEELWANSETFLRPLSELSSARNDVGQCIRFMPHYPEPNSQHTTPQKTLSQVPIGKWDFIYKEKRTSFE